MATYNIAVTKGFTYDTFLEALKGMWIKGVVAFFLQEFISVPIAMKILPHIVDTQNSKPLLIAVCRGGLLVFTMSPMMTLFATILNNGIGKNTLLLWLEQLTRNFAFSLFVQVFYVGPLVRVIHGKIFTKKVKN
jgi:hypothetical protein